MLFTLSFASDVSAQLNCPPGTRPVYLHKKPADAWPAFNEGYCATPEGLPRGQARGWRSLSLTDTEPSWSGEFADGIKHGQWTEFGTDLMNQQVVKTRGSYLDGRKHGMWWEDEGRLIPYVHGKKHGSVRKVGPSQITETIYRNNVELRIITRKMDNSVIVSRELPSQIPPGGVEVSRSWTGIMREIREENTNQQFVAYEYQYLKGKLHGQYRTWHSRDRKSFEGEFFEGRPWGTFRWYNTDGTLLQQVELTNGSGQFIGPIPEDDPTKHAIRGIFDGSWESEPLDSGSGYLWRFEGISFTKGELREGRPHGKWNTSSDVGRCEAEFENGRRHGTLRCWSRPGMLSREEQYQNGKLHGWVRHWNQQGRKTLEAEFQNNKLSGRLRVWDDRDAAGTLIWTSDNAGDDVTLTAAPNNSLSKGTTLVFSGGYVKSLAKRLADGYLIEWNFVDGIRDGIHRYRDEQGSGEDGIYRQGKRIQRTTYSRLGDWTRKEVDGPEGHWSEESFGDSLQSKRVNYTDDVEKFQVVGLPSPVIPFASWPNPANITPKLDPPAPATSSKALDVKVVSSAASFGGAVIVTALKTGLVREESIDPNANVTSCADAIHRLSKDLGIEVSRSREQLEVSRSEATLNFPLGDEVEVTSYGGCIVRSVRSTSPVAVPTVGTTVEILKAIRVLRTAGSETLPIQLL